MYWSKLGWLLHLFIVLCSECFLARVSSLYWCTDWLELFLSRLTFFPMFKPRKWVTCARKYGSVTSNWINEMDVRWLEFVFRVKLSFAQSLMSLSNHFYVLFDLIAWNYNPDDLWTKSITFGSNFLGRHNILWKLILPTIHTSFARQFKPRLLIIAKILQKQ